MQGGAALRPGRPAAASSLGLLPLPCHAKCILSKQRGGFTPAQIMVKTRTRSVLTNAVVGGGDGASREQIRLLSKLFYERSTATNESPAPSAVSTPGQLVSPRMNEPLFYTDLPLWRVQATVLPGTQSILHVHVPHYVHMFDEAFALARQRNLSSSSSSSGTGNGSCNSSNDSTGGSSNCNSYTYSRVSGGGSHDILFGHLFLPNGSRSLGNPDFSLAVGSLAPKVGCLMRVEQAVRLLDGKLLILATALSRFRVVEPKQETPFSRATVEYLPDEEEVLASRSISHAAAAASLAQISAEGEGHLRLMEQPGLVERQAQAAVRVVEAAAAVAAGPAAAAAALEWQEYESCTARAVGGARCEEPREGADEAETSHLVRMLVLGGVQEIVPLPGGTVIGRCMDLVEVGKAADAAAAQSASAAAEPVVRQLWSGVLAGLKLQSLQQDSLTASSNAALLDISGFAAATAEHLAFNTTAEAPNLAARLGHASDGGSTEISNSSNPASSSHADTAEANEVNSNVSLDLQKGAADAAARSHAAAAAVNAIDSVGAGRRPSPSTSLPGIFAPGMLLPGLTSSAQHPHIQGQADLGLGQGSIEDDLLVLESCIWEALDAIATLSAKVKHHRLALPLGLLQLRPPVAQEAHAVKLRAAAALAAAAAVSAPVAASPKVADESARLVQDSSLPLTSAAQQPSKLLLDSGESTSSSTGSNSSSRMYAGSLPSSPTRAASEGSDTHAEPSYPVVRRAQRLSYAVGLVLPEVSGEARQKLLELTSIRSRLRVLLSILEGGRWALSARAAVEGLGGGGGAAGSGRM